MFRALLLTTLALPAPAQFTPTQRAIAGFDAAVARGVAKDAAGCVTVAVFRGADVLWSKGYGWADIERDVPATPDTIGRIGSITKSVTAVVAAQLVERGTIAWDDAVHDHLPELKDLARRPAEAPAITFRMLASHTAGLIREPRLAGAASGPIDGWQDKVLASIPHTSFAGPPGTRHAYSNIGFAFLGLACARAASTPYRALVERGVFGPLKMTSSAFVIDARLRPRLSVGYARDRRSGEISAETATREHAGRGYKVPNGGIYSTVGDLARFAAAMMGAGEARILSPAARTGLFAVGPTSPRYGLGFAVRRTDDGARIVGHGGSVAGYNASLDFDLESKLGVASLRTTAYRPKTGELLRELIAAAAR